MTAVFESVGVHSRRTDWPLGRKNEALNATGSTMSERCVEADEDEAGYGGGGGARMNHLSQM
jgi:hypothetical protein